MNMEEVLKRRLEKQKQLFKQLGIGMDAQHIHEKQFDYKLRGYDTEAVDRFLDEVVKDYERFYAHIADLMDKQKEHEEQIRSLKESGEQEWRQHFIERKQLEDVIEQLEFSVRQLSRLTKS